MERFHQIFTAGFCAVVLTSSVATAALLTGSGTHLPVPPVGVPSSQGRTTTGNTVTGPWQGSWVAPAAPAWIGSYDVTGPLPAGTSNNAGTSTYDFASSQMPNGELPVGTYFRFGDVDLGSGTMEIFTLTASDSGGQITTPWLNEPMWASGTGSGGGGAVTLDDMPSWSYAAGVYTFDGSTVVGNPNVNFMLTNQFPLEQLVVNRQSEFANFSLLAPISIPEPGSIAMIAIGSLAMFRRMRKV